MHQRERLLSQECILTFSMHKYDLYFLQSALALTSEAQSFLNPDVSDDSEKLSARAILLDVVINDQIYDGTLQLIHSVTVFSLHLSNLLVRFLTHYSSAMYHSSHWLLLIYWSIGGCSWISVRLRLDVTCLITVVCVIRR